MRNRIAATVFAALMTVQTIDAGAAPQANGSGGGSGIDAMTSIPTQGVKVIESGGRMIALTDNGRWVFKGEIIDTWGMKTLTSVQDVERSVSRINLNGLPLDLADLAPVEIGKQGAPRVVAFIDPRCPHCEHMLQQAPGLMDRYRFVLLPIGVLGNESWSLVRKAFCAEDQDAARQAVLTGRYDTLSSERKDCDLTPLQRRLVTAQLLGANAVPFLIAPDGRVSRGAPRNLGEWLDGGAE